MWEVTLFALRAIALIAVSIWLMLTTHGTAVGAAVSLLFVMAAKDIAVILRQRRHHQPVE
ncbi:hypothetical protein [Candidatus Mycobacterium methanotrophicum]|uniref:hypothetical protein n=1 Tax=Candidatus Mycobacterium methanotrophicum TaxID=2943498 RepID=UPI001C57ED0C|nr:hypothetical protein [Candidatus Mycobacterium methanotrophicum]